MRSIEAEALFCTQQFIFDEVGCMDVHTDKVSHISRDAEGVIWYHMADGSIQHAIEVPVEMAQEMVDLWRQTHPTLSPLILTAMNAQLAKQRLADIFKYRDGTLYVLNDDIHRIWKDEQGLLLAESAKDRKVLSVDQLPKGILAPLSTKLESWFTVNFMFARRNDYLYKISESVTKECIKILNSNVLLEALMYLCGNPYLSDYDDFLFHRCRKVDGMLMYKTSRGDYHIFNGCYCGMNKNTLDLIKKNIKK